MTSLVLELLKRSLENSHTFVYQEVGGWGWGGGGGGGIHREHDMRSLGFFDESLL